MDRQKHFERLLRIMEKRQGKAYEAEIMRLAKEQHISNVDLILYPETLDLICIEASLNIATGKKH